MRVTYLEPVGTVGGAEKVLLAAIRGLRDTLPEFTPTMIQLAEGPLRQAAEKLGVRVVVVPLPPALAGFGDTQLRDRGRLGQLGATLATALRGGPALAGFLARFRRAIADSRPELVHSNGVKVHLLSRVCRPRGVPCAWHLQDFYSERPLVGRMLRRAVPGVTLGIAASGAVKRDTAGVLPGLPVRTVLNAIDTEHYSPGESDGSALDRLAGLSEHSGVRVGLVATYANWKGQDVFLDALARVPGVRGYVVGGPIYATAGSQFRRGDLEARAAALGLAGRVGFVPFQADPRDVYRALDVVVHASTRPEPFGLTIAEGMSCGRAVVVSAGGGAAELFTEGLDALGHAPGDVEGLAAAIGRLAADAGFRARLGAQARLTAAERFGLARYGRELAAIYRELVPPPRPHAQ